MCQIERGAIQPGGQVCRLNLGGEDVDVAAVEADTFHFHHIIAGHVGGCQDAGACIGSQ